MSGSTPDYNQILLDGVAFELVPGGMVRPTAVDRFPGKVTIGGDYTIDSNDLLSAWVISDLSGGHGIKDLREGVEDNRLWFGNLYTRHPQAFVKPYATTDATLVAAASDVYPLGDLYAGGAISRYYARGTTLYQQDLPTGTTTGRGSITGAPTNHSVGFAGTGADAILYVPQGANGYSAFNPTTGPTLRNVSAAELMLDFEVWDDKLIGLSTAGQLYRATAGTASADTTFTSYGTGGKLDPSFVPKRLHAYWNQSRELVPYVVTARGVFAFDAATPRLYQIPDFESPHPDFGCASCVWRGNLYVAAGMSVFEFNGNVIRPMGLDRDDGLPRDIVGTAGTIIDLVPGVNALYALVKGRNPSGSTHHVSVHEWSGFGWHTTAYRGSAEATAPVAAIVSQSGGGHQLVWGIGGGLYRYQTLPRGPFNPKQVVTDLTFAAGTFYFDTPWFDAAMPGYTKIANAVAITFAQFPADHTCTVEYKIDGETAYTTLGVFDDVLTGDDWTETFSFGTADAYGVRPGKTFKKIHFRFTLADSAGTPTTTPVIKGIVFSFLKVMNPSWSWVLSLDLSATVGLYSPEQQFAKLVELKDGGRFFALQHRDETYRVRIAGLGAAEETGLDTRSRVELNLIEVPEVLGAPVATYSHRDTQNGSGTATVTVTKPTGTSNGDLLIAAIRTEGGLTIEGGATPPAGWTLAERIGFSTLSIQTTELFWKVASSEPSSYTFTGGGETFGIVSCFSGTPPAAPLDADGSQANTGTVNATAPSITTTRTHGLLVWVGGHTVNSGTVTPPSGMTEPTNGDLSNANNGIALAYLLDAGDIGATGAKTGTLSGSGDSGAILAAFRRA